MQDDFRRRLIQGLGLVIAGAILAYGTIAPPPADVSAQAQIVLAVFFATIVLWIAKPVPYAVSSILAVVLLFGLGGVDSFETAVSGFASTLVFFFLLLYLIGKSVAKVDLDNWVARRLVSTSSTPKTSTRRLSSAILFIAFVMPSAFARTVTFMPVVDQVNDLYDLEEASAFRRFGFYLLGHVNPIASMAVMTGGGMAVVTAELINDMVRPFTWAEWAIYMLPPVVVLYTLCLLAASLLIGVDDVSEIDRAVGDTDSANADAGDDPLNREQWIVVTTLGLAIIAWIVGSFIGVDAIIPAMAVVFIYAVPRVRILTAEEIRNVNWGIILLLGTMLSLLEAMERVNALDRIIETMVVLIPADGPSVLSFAIVIVIAVLIRGTFSSSSAAMVVLFPLVLEFAVRFGFDPLFTAFGVMMLLMVTVFLPFNLPTVLVAYDDGPLTIPEVFGLGLLTLGMTAMVVIGSWLIYWPTIDAVVTGIF